MQPESCLDESSIELKEDPAGPSKPRFETLAWLQCVTLAGFWGR